MPFFSTPWGRAMRDAGILIGVSWFAIGPLVRWWVNSQEGAPGQAFLIWLQVISLLSLVPLWSIAGFLARSDLWLHLLRMVALLIPFSLLRLAFSLSFSFSRIEQAVPAPVWISTAIAGIAATLIQMGLGGVLAMMLGKVFGKPGDGSGSS